MTSVSRGVLGGVAIVAVAALVVAVSALVSGQAGAPARQTGSASPPLATPIESSPLPSGSLAPSVAPSITAPEPTPAAAGTARVLRETEVSIVSGGCDDAFEPIVATHPSDPSRIAVAYQRYRRIGGRCHLDPVVAISHDGGTTWKVATARPWAGSGRFPDHHVAIAWGPGPRNGAARLYWADMTVAGPSGGHLASVAWSDDEGASWSRLHVERRTPPWIGGFPDITVDRNPASPNYGVVYVAYNWLADPRRGVQDDGVVLRIVGQKHHLHKIASDGTRPDHHRFAGAIGVHLNHRAVTGCAEDGFEIAAIESAESRLSSAICAEFDRM